MRLFSPFVLSPSTPFVLSLSKERTVLRAGLSKDERISGAFLHTLFSPVSGRAEALPHIVTRGAGLQACFGGTGLGVAAMKTPLPVVLVLAALCSTAEAQVLATADTLGSGKQAVLLSENRIFVDGFRLHIVVGQYARGLADRLDLYLAAGVTRTDDETATTVNQPWLGVGGNWNVARWKGFSASLFGIVSVPLTRRDQASVVLANPALIVSRTLIQDRLALYGGVNALVPIGRRERGLFTPPDAKFNFPAGALIMLGKWGLFGEVDIGHLKALGFGLARAF
jgi:hypothetical protein